MRTGRERCAWWSWALQDRLSVPGGEGRGRGTRLVQLSICCDAADQKGGAAEADGRMESLAGNQMPSENGSTG